MFRILLIIYLILSLFKLITTIKIQYVNDFDSLKFNEVYDAKVIQNFDGNFAFLTFKTNKSQYKLSKFNLNQNPPQLLLDYVQPYYITIKRHILYLPSWGQICTYGLDQSRNPYYNIQTGKYIANTPLLYRKVIGSDIYKKMIFIGSFNILWIVRKIDSFIEKINIPILLLVLPFQIGAYPDIEMKLSQNQKYFGIVNKKIWINKVGIDIFDISGFPKYVKFIVPDQIKKVGGYKINSFCWKNSDILFINYVFSGGIKRICKYNITSQANFCIRKNASYLIQQIHYSQLFQKVILYVTYFQSWNYTSRGIFFLNQQNLSFQSVKNLTDVNFQVKKIIFQWFNQSVILTQIGPKSALINKIMNTCQIDQYFDTCLNKCTKFHQNCTNFTQQGCNCQQTIVQQLQEQQEWNYFTLEQQIIQFNQNYTKIIQNFMNYSIIVRFDQVPNLRPFFKPVHAFFMNFADFYLYIYHQRQFNHIINLTLYYIRDLQQKKWNFFRLNQFQQNIMPNMTEYENFVSQKIQYSPKKFMFIENHSNEFLVHTQNFIFPTSVAIIFLFLLFRGSFFALKKFELKISKFFKQFQYWPYLVIILLEGNQLIFSYLYAFQLKWLFSTNIITKIKQIILILLFFLIFWFTSSSFLIYRYLYNKSAGRLFENIRNTNLGAFHLITYKGIRYLFMGFIHAFINDRNEYKLFYLFLTQSIFLSEYIYIMKMKSIVLIKILAWIQVYVGFIRLLLIYNFSLDQNLIKLFPQTILLDYQISQKLILIYFILTTMNTFLYILKFFVQIFYSRSMFNKIKQLLKIFQKNKKIIKQDKISNSNLMIFNNIKMQQIFKKKQNRVKVQFKLEQKIHIDWKSRKQEKKLKKIKKFQFKKTNLNRKINNINVIFEIIQ